MTEDGGVREATSAAALSAVAGGVASGAAPVRPAIVGLGNPGEMYAATRHNLGFRVVDRLAGASGWTEECGALVAEVEGLLLVKPQTFMNRSGWSLRCLFERGSLAIENCLVVYDDVALPLGTLRMRPSGGPGGHRGLESIVEQLRTADIARLRCGVADGVTRTELSEFVLSPFAATELDSVAAVIDRAALACRAWATEGFERAASQFNGPPREA